MTFLHYQDVESIGLVAGVGPLQQLSIAGGMQALAVPRDKPYARLGPGSCRGLRAYGASGLRSRTCFCGRGS